MADGTDTIESTTTIEDPPAGSTEAGSELGAEAPVLDLDQYGDHLVPVKVGGEEQRLPLSQVRDGLMMQADYTRKTQEVARQAQEQAEAIAIAEALARDPEGTIDVLREWYLESTDGTQDATSDSTTEELDPLEREVKELRGWVSAQEQAAAEAALQTELDQFHEQYGVDQAELLRFAVEHQIPSLEWAYAVMQHGASQAASQLQQENEAAEAARLAAKQQSTVVGGGADRASGGSTVPTGDRSTVRSVGDAARLAMQQLGIGG